VAALVVMMIVARFKPAEVGVKKMFHGVEADGDKDTGKSPRVKSLKVVSPTEYADFTAEKPASVSNPMFASVRAKVDCTATDVSGAVVKDEGLLLLMIS